MTRATIHYINERVYCSSTGHYQARVHVDRDGKREHYEYDFDGTLLWKGKRDWRERACPKYLEAAILEKLRELYADGILRVYENDRDGNRRYDDLRYHVPEQFEWLIGLRTVESEAN